MKRSFFLLQLLIFNALSSFACLNTYQFKIFPVGIHKDAIVPVDIQIRRTSQAEGSRWLNLGLDSIDDQGEMWIMNAFVSKYDKNQRILEKDSLEMTYSIGKHYLDSLQMIYSKGIERIINSNSEIKLFNPSYISFCDFQQSCELIQLSADSINDRDYLVYAQKKYPIDIIRDTSYYGFGKSIYHPQNIMGLYANSVRVYEVGTFQLVISHLATGHEIGMGWITSDSNKFREKQAKGEPVTLAKEYKLEIDFSDIKSSVYEEPLLHHGYGFDVFVVNE